MNSRVSLLILTLCFPFLVLAQPLELEEAQSPPEAIQVIGDRSIMQLRIQMMEAEKKAYDIFNQFNDEKRFNIHCTMHQPTGTRIERQVCTTNFESEATRTHAQAYFENTRETLGAMAACSTSGSGCQPPTFSFPMLYAPAEVMIASQQKEYKQKIKQVAEENPEFLEAIIQFSEVRQRYEAATSTGNNQD